MTQTLLDAAHAATLAAPEDDALRLRFYERLADGELFLLLTREAAGEVLDPQVFELEEGAVVLAFDTEARLAEFTGGPTPYAALPGRVLVRMLAGQGLGLGLNLGVAPSERLLPASALTWLGEMLAAAPAEIEARPEELLPPHGLPEALLQALDAKLARAAGLARFAWLAGVRYEGGGRGHVLAFIDAAQGAEGPLARAAGEALRFSGIEAGAIDVIFLQASDPLAAGLARHGLRFDLPDQAPETQLPGSAPGMDPQRPPKLR